MESHSECCSNMDIYGGFHERENSVNSTGVCPAHTPWAWVLCPNVFQGVALRTNVHSCVTDMLAPVVPRVRELHAC